MNFDFDIPGIVDIEYLFICSRYIMYYSIGITVNRIILYCSYLPINLACRGRGTEKCTVYRDTR